MLNIEIVFLDFLKNNVLDLCGLWFGRQHSFASSSLLFCIYKTV